jgi:5-methylcytosine-specific restriction enzyme A
VEIREPSVYLLVSCASNEGAIVSTYLLTWNPKKVPWDDLEECVEVIDEQGHLDGDWSCEATNKIEEGDRVYLMRLGDERRGIVASGWVRAHDGGTVLPWSDVYEGEHWNEQAESDTTWYVDIRFDAMLGRERTLPLSRLERLNDGLSRSVKRQFWTPQKSGIRIRNEVAPKLENEWKRFLASGISKEESKTSSLIGEGFLARHRDRRRARSIRPRPTLDSRFRGQKGE